MNEQLIVKNFGPIKDATVDFKRVTVFIGPTGGGKSTLAKLASTFRDESCAYDVSEYELFQAIETLLSDYSILGYQKENNSIIWHSPLKKMHIINDEISSSPLLPGPAKVRLEQLVKEVSSNCKVRLRKGETVGSYSFLDRLHEALPSKIGTVFQIELNKIFPDSIYIPSERVFASAIEGSVFGLRKSKIALPSVLENFMSNFENARKEIHFFSIPFLDINYSFREGENKLQLKDKTIIDLSESASGVQSVLPLLLVIDYFTNDNIARSFIIEEPELNLYPTAQQELLNWLVNKCTKGENDLTITTHSPYILSHLNLLLYAYQVAEKHPDRREAVAAIVPEANWINPKEFACYHVGDGGVKSLVDEELGLIDNNELDNISGDKADAFDQLISINRGFTHA